MEGYYIKRDKSDIRVVQQAEGSLFIQAACHLVPSSPLEETEHQFTLIKMLGSWYLKI